MENVEYFENPHLVRPCFILGFEGWPNAAEISSFALQHLIESLQAKKFASLVFETFYQLSSSRPVARIKEGRVGEVKFPEHHFYYSKMLSRDLILFLGVEPHFHWGRFAEGVLEVAERFEVSKIVTIGGTYDYLPHTYPPLISAVFNDETLREEVVQRGLALTEYHGPISIHTFLLEEARKKGIRAISLWGHAPHYLQARNLKVIHAVLQCLADLTRIEIDLSELKRLTEVFDEQIKQVMKQDPKLQQVISKLEEVYQKSEELAPPRKKETESKQEEKVVYLQAFLKKQEDEEE